MRAKTALMAPLAFGGRLLKTPLSPRAVPSLRCFSQGHSMRRKARDNGSESMAARPPVVFPCSGRCRGVGKESNTARTTGSCLRVCVALGSAVRSATLNRWRPRSRRQPWIDRNWVNSVTPTHTRRTAHNAVTARGHVHSSARTYSCLRKPPQPSQLLQAPAFLRAHARSVYVSVATRDDGRAVRRGQSTGSP